jgi:hypothetical protein
MQFDPGLATQLRETYEKSLELSLKMNTFRRENFRQFESNRMMDRINNIQVSMKKLRVESETKSPLKPRVSYSKSPNFKSSKLLETHRQSPSAAQGYFKGSLLESQSRLKKSRAGFKARDASNTPEKPEVKIITELQSHLPISSTETTGAFNDLQAPRSISPINYDRRASSVTPTPKKLPHYDYITGKISKAIELPTFQEYCRNKKWQEASLTNIAELKKKVSSADQKLKNFRKEISGLEIYLGMDTGVKWDGNKRFLRRLNYEPTSKDTIVKVYIDRMKAQLYKRNSQPRGKRQGIAAIFNEREKYDFRNLLIEEDWDSDGESAASGRASSQKRRETEEKTAVNLQILQAKPKQIEEVFDKCVYNFLTARKRSEEKLHNIVDRINKDRNFNYNEKFRAFNQDSDRFVSSCHTSHKLQTFRKKIEIKRRAKRYYLEEQALLYEEVLKILRDRNRYPSEQELLLIDFVKRLTEEENLVSNSNMNEFLRMIPEEDRKDPNFKELVDHIIEAINKKENMV